MKDNGKGKQDQKQEFHDEDAHDRQLAGPFFSVKLAEMSAEKVTPEIQELYAKRRDLYAEFHEAVAAAHRGKAEGDDRAFHKAMARRHDVEAEADRINAELFRAGVLFQDVDCW